MEMLVAEPTEKNPPLVLNMSHWQLEFFRWALFN